MKSLVLIAAFLFFYVFPVDQVEGSSATSPMENMEALSPGAKVRKRQTCAPSMDIEQAHRNFIMTICEQMHPGFTLNMMVPGTTRNVMQSGQNLGRRHLDDEVSPAQFPPADPYYDPNAPWPHIVFPPGSSRGMSKDNIVL